MIDVVFQLIIFFMYTSQFTALTRSPVELPTEPGEENGDQTTAIVVDLRADGTYLVERQELPLERVVDLVRREVARASDPAEVELLVRADRAGAAQHLNALASRLAEIGVRDWQLGTSRPPGSGEAP